MKTVFLEEIIDQEICDEMMPLFQKHWEEVSHPAFKDFQKLNPDFSKYIAMGKNRDATGKPCAVLFTMREVTDADQEGARKGRLVGYWCFFINDTLHYKGTTQALGDVLFVEKEYRGKRAYEFVAECVNQLKMGGVQVVHVYSKKEHDLTRMFVDGLGFEQIDLHFTKRLN
jgi:hypothetical protein